jgi:hypothetical protein
MVFNREASPAPIFLKGVGAASGQDIFSALAGFDSREAGDYFARFA